MNVFLTSVLALGIVAARPPLTGSEWQTAVRNYKALLAGQKQLFELSPVERQNVIELDKWLRSTPGIATSETKERCRERLASRSPSALEEALIDLKCSQRPSGS